MITPLDELLGITTALDISGVRSDFEELETQIPQLSQELEQLVLEEGDSIPETTRLYFQDLFIYLRKLSDGISLFDLYQGIDLVDRMPDELAVELDWDAMATISTVVSGVKFVLAVTIIFVLLPALLTALGGIRHSTVLVALGMILSLGITALLFRPTHFFPCLLLHITTIVLCVKANKAYRAYLCAPDTPAS